MTFWQKAGEKGTAVVLNLALLTGMSAYASPENRAKSALPLGEAVETPVASGPEREKASPPGNAAGEVLTARRLVRDDNKDLDKREIHLTGKKDYILQIDQTDLLGPAARKMGEEPEGLYRLVNGLYKDDKVKGNVLLVIPKKWMIKDEFKSAAQKIGRPQGFTAVWPREGGEIALYGGDVSDPDFVRIQADKGWTGKLDIHLKCRNGKTLQFNMYDGGKAQPGALEALQSGDMKQLSQLAAEHPAALKPTAPTRGR